MASDDDFWVRRPALLALLLPLRAARATSSASPATPKRCSRSAFFIRKAIGWVLRETGRRDPDRVHAWLEPRASRASGVTIREAVKYLSEEQRSAILATHHAVQRPRT